MSKKTVSTTEEDITTHSKLIKDVEEQYGSICKDGTALLNTKPTLFKISPSIDLGLNGGILSGTWSLISGLPKTGKTTLALSIIAASQREEYNKDTNRHAYYIDVEGRLKSINLSGIVGIDTNRMTVIRSEKGNILSAEKFLSIAEKICHTCPGSILVIDSLSALCAEKELIGDMDSQTRASGPRLIAQFCRKLANVVPINDITVIAIQHLMANTSGYGQPLVEDGGNKIQYQSDLKMRVKSIEPYKVGSGQNETRVGQIINWTVLFSPLGCIPGTTINSYLRYGIGFDNIREYISQAISFGIIDKKAAWLYFGEEKFNGVDNLWTAMKENPDLLNRIKEQINQITGTQ